MTAGIRAGHARRMTCGLDAVRLIGYQMNEHEQLHRTLRAAAQLLDSAASQVRDVQLHPTKQNIRLIGEALALVFQLRNNVEAVKPELAKRYPAPTQEESAANKRLGEALLSAEDLADAGSIAQARVLLENFASQESSHFHRDIALLEAERYELRDGACEP